MSASSRSLPLQRVKRERRPWLRPVTCAALLVPLATWAQPGPAHDMHSMPGMKMEAPKASKARQGGKKPAAVPKSGARSPGKGGAAPMPSDAMPGMDHSGMPGMKQGPRPGADRRPASGTGQGAMPGMDHSGMPGMGRGRTEGMNPAKTQGMDHSQMPGPGRGPASGGGHGAMPGMDHSSMPGMDHGQMPGPDHGAVPATGQGTMPGMDMDMKSMQGGSPPSDARDPDAYADGLVHGPMRGMDMADNALYGQVLLNRFEVFHSRHGSGQALDGQAWYGGDLDKLWLKADGERVGGRLGATRTEALWNRAIATYWSVQAGVRHDFGEGPGRTWAAFGFQGLAPYWFDLQATAYAGQNGRTALRFEAEYDMRFTQRLILQPDLKVNLYGRNDPERRIGSGLSSIEGGLRLRYEFSRKFAPYIGVAWDRKFGTTAGFAREDGKAVQGTRVVAGVRIWF